MSASLLAAPAADTGGAVSVLLDAIPSETTPAERRLLHTLFRDRWAGAGHVVEIGPFLGGTTRAIALGMLANPHLEPAAELHTFDRFASYYSAAELRATIEPMVRSGVFTAAEADDICRVADFERLFHAIHAPHAYARLIRLHNSPLPDFPADVAGSMSLDVLRDEAALGAVFIDGCKSWASTHYAMAFLLPRTRVGAPVIFQDFGWYTCFWISSFTHALRDVLELETRADATYAFRLTREISAEKIAARFPKTPAELGDKFFKAASAALFERSRRAGDLRGELVAQLHHVAALATLGQKPQAAAILQKLDVRRYAADAMLMRGCIKSPTYLPGGKPILWKEAA
jgi:hypothetical protein